MESTSTKTKRCPFCSEIIQAGAIKCRFCAEFLNTDEARALEAGSAANSRSPADEEESGEILFEGRPSLWAMMGSVIRGLFFLAIAILLITQPLENMANEILKLELTENQAVAFGKYRLVVGVGLAILVVLILLVKMVKLKCTYYEVTTDRIEWSRGIFDRKVDNLDMFRVIDLKLRRSLLDCILGIGTVGLITNDKTDPEFFFEKIHRSRRLYDIIKKASLEADKQRRVVHLE